MSTSLQTENYGIGKYAPDDVTSYLTDYNRAMDKIDGAIKGVSDVANEAKATGDSNHNNIASLSEGLTATNKNVENLGKTQTAQQGEIDGLQNAVAGIVLGDFKYIQFTSAHGANCAGRLRRVGNYVQGYVDGNFNVGNYSTERALGSLNLIDFGYIAGNPLELPAIEDGSKAQLSSAFGIGASVLINENHSFVLYFDDTTNMTRICFVGASYNPTERTEYVVHF